MRSAVLTSASGLAALALGAFGAAAPGWGQEVDHADAAMLSEIRADADQHWDFLGDHCFKCHNFEDWAGGVAFDTMTADAVPADAEVWEEAVRKLRGGLMPPPGEERPDAAETDAFVGWMEA